MKLRKSPQEVGRDNSAWQLDRQHVACDETQQQNWWRTVAVSAKEWSWRLTCVSLTWAKQTRVWKRSIPPKKTLFYRYWVV